MTFPQSVLAIEKWNEGIGGLLTSICDIVKTLQDSVHVHGCKWGVVAITEYITRCIGLYGIRFMFHQVHFFDEGGEGS